MLKPTKVKIDSLHEIVSPSNTKYCYVIRPNQAKTEFPQHSKCNFPAMMDEMDANGVWNVVTGIEGQTDEVIYEINVEEKGNETFCMTSLVY